MTSVNQIKVEDDFVKDALAEFPKKQQGQEAFIKLAEWSAQGWKNLDDEVVKLGYMRLLDNAEGVLIDNIGDLFGMSRGAQTDESYRANIKLRSLRQVTDGSRDDVVDLMRIMFSGQTPLIYKGIRGFMEITVPTNCLDSTALSLELESMLPATTNLWVMQTDASLRLGFVDSTNNTQPVGTAGFYDFATGADDQGQLSNWIHSSYRLSGYR